jgi:hypothetical protein
MAKFTPSVLGATSGTFDRTTFVNSKTYKPHVRARRGTHKPAVLNEALVQSSQRQAVANKFARLIFNAVRHIQKDSTLWTRIVSVIRRQLKNDTFPDMKDFVLLECSKKCTLSEKLRGYTVHAQQAAQQLAVTVQLLCTPRFKNARYIDGYQLHVIAVFPNFTQLTSQVETFNTSIIQRHTPPEVLFVQLPIIPGADQYLLFLGITGCKRGEPIQVAHLKGLQVAAAGKLDTLTDAGTFNPDEFAWK